MTVNKTAQTLMEATIVAAVEGMNYMTTGKIAQVAVEMC